MNFLETIWLIPLFPLFGAALMLLFGKKLDPQPASEVAVAPGVEPIFEHGTITATHVTITATLTITTTGIPTTTITITTMITATITITTRR